MSGIAGASVNYIQQAKDLCPIPPAVNRRDSYLHENNETPSIADPVFSDCREKNEFSIEEWDFLSNVDELIEESKEWIELHVDRRVAFFFEQLVVCYRTPFHFEIGETMHQGESSPTITKINDEGVFVEIPFNSAHSSTIPCIYAYDRAAWNAWIQNGKIAGQKPKGFVYLQDSDSYRLHNSTIGLIKVINQADIAIDGNKQAQTPKLRMKALEILNRAAEGLITPEQGCREFVEKAVETVQQQKQARGAKPTTKVILEYYRNEFENILEEMREPFFFDRLLDVKIESVQKDSVLRSRLYKHRYQIIRECHEVQSVIMQKIKRVSAEIIGISRKPAKFDHFLKLILIERTSSRVDKVTLEKLFCLSEEQLKNQTKNFQATRRKIEETVNLTKIDNVLKGLWKDFWHLRQKELRYRKSVFMELRSFYHYTQVDVAREYKSLFPRKPMSQPGISRIENEHKIIDPSLAIDMAKVYKIEPSVFFPALFTSLAS